jgi:SAM-dependent methyltransferase
MKQPLRARKPTAADFLRDGREAFQAGRFYLAAEAYAKARALDGRNPVVVFNLASAKERIGEIDEAAVLLSEALRLRPSWEDAARRLALLLARYRIGSAAELDPHGLLAAFGFNRLDQKPIAAAAITHVLARIGLGEAVNEAAARGAEDAARRLILRRTDKALSHPLLLAALSSSPNRDPGFERLLTAIRRVLLLEVPAERFEDKALTGFVLALIHQCLVNEHIFAAEADEEDASLSAQPVDPARLLSGETGEARGAMLSLLYRGPKAVFGEALVGADARAIRPRALGDLLSAWAKEENERAFLAADIPNAGAIADAVSQRVARQYEEHPYPRWTSLQLPSEASAAEALKRHFSHEALAFLDGPFKVLIAGCGTGQHALAAAVRYGPKADVLAIDLSSASLAYAKMKAEEYGIGNLRFARADLLVPGGEGPFDIIEAVGVLHHMSEPFKGWQALLERLRPGGLMTVGLYSAVARDNISKLRSEADYPGPDCDDRAARRYRASLMARSDEAVGGLVHSYDFYTLSEFRDLILHEHERPIVLAEIEAFLAQNGLTFRGFQLPPPILQAFLVEHPKSGWPGAFADWSLFEERHPHTFDAMYRFWCQKTG